MASDGLYKPKKIFMWINPRCLSTSFEKCIAHMDGAQIWHEPYVSCYFNEIFRDPEVFQRFPNMQPFLKHFMAAKQLIEAGGHIYQGGNLLPMETFTYDWVKEQLEKPIAEGKKFMFIKDTGLGIDGHYDKLPKIEAKHTFIIRHPYRMALSVQRLLASTFDFEGDPSDLDIGSGHPFMAWEKLSPDPVFKLWKHVRENIDPNPIVIDADDLQTHPEQILRKYCENVGIPFKKEYLQWEKSDESLKYFNGALEQMVWGKTEHVYDAAFLSSCFLPLKGPVPDTIPETCMGYAKEFLKGYSVMYEGRIKPE